MNSGGETLAVKDLLCLMCLEVYEERLVEAEEAEEKDEGRQYKDIYQMEREAQEMETHILESLLPEKRESCWALVASVQNKAEGRVQKAVYDASCRGLSIIDCTEEGMLYNVLMAEAWKAAESYNPAKSAFSTWVYRRWNWAVYEFWRVLPPRNESLSAFGQSADPDNQTTLQDRLKDEDSRSPDDCLVTQELADWIDSTFDGQPLLKFMIDDAYQQCDWLCPYCRWAMWGRLDKLTWKETRCVDQPEKSVQSVYARRALWQAEV